MTNLSLDWFKSEKKEHYADLIIQEQTLKNEILQRELDNLKKEEPLYRKLKLVNNVLTVVLQDGSILSKPNATPDDFTKVREAKSEAMILIAMGMLENRGADKIEKETQEIIKTLGKIDTLKSLSEFEFEGNSVYFRGISRSLPKLLVDELADLALTFEKEGVVNEQALYSDDRYLAMKRFFMWCCLNPRAEVADDLYDFLMRNSFRLTKQGFFVALRNVVSLEEKSGSNLLVQFVSNAHTKVKSVWKKNPTNFQVWKKEDEYILHDVNKKNGDSIKDAVLVGNLKDLYLDLPKAKENRFTDNYTRTFDIRIGKVVAMPPEECSWSTADCAEAGLHFTSDEIHYVGCGDTSILILINPMKVVGIGERKGRCYEYLPIMTVPRTEATQLLHDLDFDTLQIDEEFTINELESLDEKVKLGFSAETSKHEFNLPSISTREINTITRTLGLMSEEIKDRIKPVK